MNFKKAKEYMSNGGRVTLPSWGPEDFLHMDKGVIVNDGGNPHEELLRENEITSKDWIKHPNDRECMMCGCLFDKSSLSGIKYDKDFKVCENCKETNDDEK